MAASQQVTTYRARRQFDVGQRVLASFGYEPKHLGVVSDVHTWASGRVSVYVQFAPCGAHFLCQPERISAYGDKGGWTNAEYRIERERAWNREHARAVEAERQQRYPGQPFSAYREGV